MSGLRTPAILIAITGLLETKTASAPKQLALRRISQSIEFLNCTECSRKSSRIGRLEFRSNDLQSMWGH